MKMISLTVLAAAALSVSPALAATSVSRVEMPCKEAGHGREQACVVVDKFLSGNNPTADSTMNMSVAQPLKGKARSYSVIYVYHVHPGSNSGVTVSVNRGNDSIMSDVDVGKPTAIWTSTRDGGTTWSDLNSNN